MISLQDGRTILVCKAFCESANVPGTICINVGEILEVIDVKALPGERWNKPASQLLKTWIPLSHVKMITEYNGAYVSQEQRSRAGSKAKEPLNFPLSQEFEEWCRANGQDPQTFALWLFERAWERHKEEDAYSKEQLKKEGSR